MSGLCSDLCNIYNKTYISTKSYLFEEALPEPRPTSASPTTEVVSEDRVAVSPFPPFPPLTTDVSPEHGVGDSVPANEASPVYNGPQSHSSPANGCEDIEHFRGVEYDGVNIVPDSPIIKHASLMIDDDTPAPSKMGSASVPSPETNSGTHILQTPDLTVSPGYRESEFGTPMSTSEKGVHPEYTVISQNVESTIAEPEVSFEYLVVCIFILYIPSAFPFHFLVLLLNSALCSSSFLFMRFTRFRIPLM